MILKEVDLFKGVDYSIMEQITDICSEEIFDRDSIIFEKGAPANDLYILEEGSLKLVVEDKASLSFSLTEPGTVFGWSSLAESGRYTSSGVCATDLKAIRIDGKGLEKILKAHPEVGLNVLRRLMDILSDRLLTSYEAHLNLLDSMGSKAAPSYG